MKLSRLLLFFSSLFFPFLTQAQSKPTLNTGNDCGTPNLSKSKFEEIEKRMEEFLKKNISSPKVITNIPIKAHIVRYSNGSGGLSVTDLNNAIATMNAQYAPIEFQYYLCGPIHYIDDDNLADCDVSTDNSTLVLNNVNDAINIYFTPVLVVGGSGLNGISAFPSGNANDNRIIMRNGATTNGSTLSHEVGHYWNLYHTHETAVGNELVNGTNCTTAGDLVCDTPADPCCYFYNSTTCTYTGTGLDANGQTYNPMINNFMSYYQGCRTLFTNGQFTRMGAGYNTRLNLMQISGAYSFACNGSFAAAPTNLLITPNGCQINLSWTDNSNNEMGFIIESSTSPTGPFVALGKVAVNATTFTDSRNLSNGITYYYRVVAANSNANSSAVGNIVFSGGGNCICTPTAQDCNDNDVITLVKIMQNTTTLLNNSSSCSVNGYNFYSTPVTNLNVGVTYSLTVQNLGYYPEGSVAWIDYNNDGSFSSTEKIFEKPVSTWTSSVQNFVVPNTATAGQKRMRVRIAYDSLPSDACNNSSTYGETEDYMINILNPCTAILNPTGTITTNQLASQYIETSGVNIINSNSKVTYGANRYIKLNHGFLANPSTTGNFIATTTGCN